MLKNYLKIALRNLTKHFGYTFINLTGLALGIACCLFIVRFVVHELSYDRFHADADRIERIVLNGQVSGNAINAPVSPSPMAAALVSDFPEVEQATRLFNFGGDVVVRRGDQRFVEKNVLFVDSTFFDLFSFEMLQGDPQTALAPPQTIVLTQRMAKKYFGNEDPVDQTLVLGDTTRYQVTGVVANPPSNSHFDFDFLATLTGIPIAESPFWISNNFFTYLRLKEGSSPGDVEAKLEPFFKKYAAPQIVNALGITYDAFEEAGNILRYHLQPMTSIHLHSNYEFELGTNSSMAFVYVFSAIALFILVLACINFMNLATARAANRAREVGVRKAVGSTRGQLVSQFISEAVLMTLVATLLAIGLVVLFMPLFNDLAGTDFSAAFLGHPVVLLLMAGGALLVGLLAGSYPAFFLSHFKPVAVLKGSIEGAARNKGLRNGLVVFQFGISIALLAGTFIVYHQLQYMRNTDLGFDKEHVLVIARANELGRQKQAFKQELLTLPNVVNASYANSLPGGIFGQTGFMKEGAPEGKTELMAPVVTDFDYLKTLGLELVAGRDFDRRLSTDSTAVIINESAAKALGWDDPIGKHLASIGGQAPGSGQQGEIIGVVKDFHYASLHQEIGDVAIAVSSALNPLGWLAVRVRGENLNRTVAAIEQKWQDFLPGNPITYSFLDDTFDNLYQNDQRLGELVTIFALFAVFIACLGLFGLASFTTEQRTKEIGVRKALGATVPQILLLLTKDFTKLVVIAFVIAAPIAYYAMNRWLQDFAYRAGLPWYLFVLAGVAALAVAWLTVSYQSIKAASANPVTALRYE